MKKQIYFLLLVSILFLASCSSKSIDKEVNENSKQSISIYYMDYDLPLLNNITYFNSSNTKVNIVATKFKNEEEYENKITTEILAGDGPDIFVDYDIFKSIRTVALTGVFCDLNELIEKDKSFKLSEYNTKILDCGVIDGKRYFIPTGYNCNGFYTTKELLTKNNISIDDSKWTWNDFARIAKSFAEKNKSKENYLVGWNFSFFALMHNCGLSFIDFENRKSNFDSPQFIELLQIYKEIYPTICTNDVISTKKVDSHFELLDKGLSVLIYDRITPFKVFANNSVIKGKMNSEMQMLSMPTYESGGTILAKLSQLAAINSKCKYKEKAFEFIKLLLSKEGRNKLTDQTIPVKTDVFKDELTSFLKSDVNLIHGRFNYTNYEADPINITQEMFDRINKIVDKTQGMQIITNTVSDIVESGVTELLSNKKSAEQVAKEINEKVTVFLNE